MAMEPRNWLIQTLPDLACDMVLEKNHVINPKVPINPTNAHWTLSDSH
jgi:hypothetical protein